MKNIVIFGLILLLFGSLNAPIFAQEAVATNNSFSELLKQAEAKTAAKEWKNAAAL